MSEGAHLPGNAGQEKSKWLTYGGKVDESLMNMLKEAQKTAGIKKFSDFMNDMLGIYRANKQEAEPPQMQVIKKAVADIMMTTESLLDAMQIIEDDKFRSIDEYRQRLQEAEENTVNTAAQINELEEKLAALEKELQASRMKTQSAHAELATEFERRKNIEGMIQRIQQLADEAVINKEKAEAERNSAVNRAADAKDKITLLQAANQELQKRLETALAAMEQNQTELIAARDWNKNLNELLSQETILRNRLEERLQIIGPQHQAAADRLEALKTEINRLQANEQLMVQKVLTLESELKHATEKLQAVEV